MIELKRRQLMKQMQAEFVKIAQLLAKLDEQLPEEQAKQAA